MQTFISEYCPNCEAEIEWRSGLFSRNTVGPESEKCPHCGEAYKTGRKEWAGMSAAEHRDFYRRVFLRCLAAFVFWFMGVMLAAFFVTGAIFNPSGQTPMPLGITIGIGGGGLLAVRVYQLARRQIKNSLEREPGDM